MTPEEWARVFEAGYKQLESLYTLSSPVAALGAALEAMADEAKIIARERADL